MVNLKCSNPTCNFIWTPRVIKPKACPNCKRHFTANFYPVETDEPATSERIQKVITPTAYPIDNLTRRQHLCDDCQRENSMSSTYSDLEFQGLKLCMRHVEARVKELNNKRA